MEWRLMKHRGVKQDYCLVYIAAADGGQRCKAVASAELLSTNTFPDSPKFELDPITYL